jgi:hypothetical protein
MRFSVLGCDDASLGIWFPMFRDNIVTQCHVPEEPIPEMTLFSLSVLSYVILVQISTHPYENAFRSPPELHYNKTCPVIQ